MAEENFGPELLNICVALVDKISACVTPWIHLGLAVVLARFDTSKPPCTHSLWPNIICAASNWIFTGLPALYVVWDDPWRRILTLLALVSSTVYHLAEVKSRLPGLPYLRKHASLLIQLDRLFAFILMVNTVLRMYYNGINWLVMAIGLAGVSFAMVSERRIGWWFVLWHSLWHNAAFLAVLLV
jgi:hypothetical protein